jgi:4-diphosphocytidyl-2-C-methyl-D-erythritol kinase
MQSLSPAKVNLYLKILGKRKDGYHNLLSVFQAISLYDKIEIKKISEDKIIFSCNIKSIDNKNNLCYKVAQILKNRYNIKSGVRIKLTKNIPLGSGLGGASSDAFTTAKMLIKLWNIKISKKDFLTFCSEVGKDIPFFYYKGCCIVKGAGEKVLKIIPWWKKRCLWIVLVYPNKILLTKDVYNKFDQMMKKGNLRCEQPRFSLKKFLKKDFLRKFLYNDLYLPATKIYPRLSFIKERFVDIGTELVSMSGSGSTMFGIYYNKKDAIRTKKILTNTIPNSRIELVKTIF